MELIFTNNVSKIQYSITGLTDLCTSALFWQFNINLPEGMLDGEYEYELKNGSDVIAKGLLQIGDYTPTKQVYNNDKTYIVYGR